jgi:hypothetical protein
MSVKTKFHHLIKIYAVVTTIIIIINISLGAQTLGLVIWFLYLAAWGITLSIVDWKERKKLTDMLYVNYPAEYNKYAYSNFLMTRHYYGLKFEYFLLSKKLNSNEEIMVLKKKINFLRLFGFAQFIFTVIMIIIIH